MHHHVRYHPYNAIKDVSHFKSDFRRLARWLTNQSVGVRHLLVLVVVFCLFIDFAFSSIIASTLFFSNKNSHARLPKKKVVLGGGGARGASHMAMLRALEEAQIPVDIIGGTSIGAFMGALYASKGGDTMDMHSSLWRFAEEMSSLWLKVRDLTFPIVSYVKGAQFNQMLVRVFRDTLIEDLWLNFYCVTTDLTDSKQVVHRNGYAWKYVRASMTLTGLLPPVCDVGLGADSRVHYLVDGGYTNVLPVDVMRRLIGNSGTLISADVQAEWSLEGEDYGDDLNGFWFMWRRLMSSLMIGSPPRIPTASDIQSHLAYVSSVIQFGRSANEIRVDLALAPPIKAYSVLQFDKAKEIEERGLVYARAEVTKFVDQLLATNDKRLVTFGIKKASTLPDDFDEADETEFTIVGATDGKFVSKKSSHLSFEGPMEVPKE